MWLFGGIALRNTYKHALGAAYGKTNTQGAGDGVLAASWPFGSESRFVFRNVPLAAGHSNLMRFDLRSHVEGSKSNISIYVGTCQYIGVLLLKDAFNISRVTITVTVTW